MSTISTRPWCRAFGFSSTRPDDPMTSSLPSSSSSHVRPGEPPAKPAAFPTGATLPTRVLRRRKTLLGVAAALFLLWIGWLVYLAATTTHPIVLSRPQLLVAELVVIADVREGSSGPLPEVTVREILPRGRKLNKT